MGSLFQELRRRNVFKVGLAYAVVAFALAQAADLALPTFGAPDWVNQTILFLFVLGFPLAVILAWAYELTPGGIKSDAAVQSPQASTSSTDRKLIYATFALVLLVAGMQVVGPFLPNLASEQNIATPSNYSLENPFDRNVSVVRSIIPIGPSVPHPQINLRTGLAISPDGRRIAYTKIENESVQIYVRDLDQLEARAIGQQQQLQLQRQNGMLVSLSFSPDGEWLAYQKTGNGIFKIPLNGGPEQMISNSLFLYGLTWSVNDSIIFPSIESLNRMSASGGASESLNARPNDAEQPLVSYPMSIPGEPVLLFNQSEFGLINETGSVNLYDLENDTTQRLIDNAYNASFSTTGHIVFIRDDALWAIPFDLVSRQPTGAEVRLVEGIARNVTIGLVNYALAANGDLVYQPGEGSDFSGIAASVLSKVDRQGNESVVEMVPQGFGQPDLSPDGRHVAMVITEGLARDIWNYDLDRGTLSRVTFEGDASNPLWYPDGTRLAFGTLQELKSINASGLGDVEILTTNLMSRTEDEELTRTFLIPTSFTPDGAELFYVGAYGRGVRDIYKVGMTPEHVSNAVIDTSYQETNPKISPDGHWLAYISDETGQVEVYIRPYPNIEDDKWQISTGGGGDPQWAAETGELFYRKHTDTDIVETYAVAIEPGEEFKAGIPQLLFSSDHSHPLEGHSYAVSADGQQFIMLKPSGQDATPTPIDTNLVLVKNFGAELLRRVPADKQ